MQARRVRCWFDGVKKDIWGIWGGAGWRLKGSESVDGRRFWKLLVPSPRCHRRKKGSGKESLALCSAPRSLGVFEHLSLLSSLSDSSPEYRPATTVPLEPSPLFENTPDRRLVPLSPPQWLPIKRQPTRSSCRATRPLQPMTGRLPWTSTPKPLRNPTRSRPSFAIVLRYGPSPTPTTLPSESH